MANRATVSKEIITVILAGLWKPSHFQEGGGVVVVTGRLTIPTADGNLLHYSAVASEPLESASKAPAAEVAASSALRRAAALSGLALDLWG
jgi:hypothetical protein